MDCHCYLRNIQDLLSDEKTPYERRFGMPSSGPVFPFGALVAYHPNSAKDLSILHQIGPKVLPCFSLVNDSWSWEHRIVWIARHGTQNAVQNVYHSGTLASFAARAGTSCEKEERNIRNSSSTRWTSFPYLTSIWRKDDLTDTDSVRSRETRNTTSPTSWRRSARRRTSRVSMTDLYDMNNSAVEWFKLMEPKIFETNDGHKAILLHGGVGKVLGGLFTPMKVTMEMMNQVLIEQGNLLYK